MFLLINMLFHKAMFDYIKGHDIMTILSCRNTHQTMQFNANLYKIAITYYNMGLTISFHNVFVNSFLALNKSIFFIFLFLIIHCNWQHDQSIFHMYHNHFFSSIDASQS